MPLQAAQDGGSARPQQEARGEVASEACRLSLQGLVSAPGAEAAAHRGVSQQIAQLDKKLGSGGSLSVLASGRSEGAEHPMPPAGAPFRA